MTAPQSSARNIFFCCSLSRSSLAAMNPLSMAVSFSPRGDVDADTCPGVKSALRPCATERLDGVPFQRPVIPVWVTGRPRVWLVVGDDAGDGVAEGGVGGVDFGDRGLGLLPVGGRLQVGDGGFQLRLKRADRAANRGARIAGATARRRRRAAARVGGAAG